MATDNQDWWMLNHDEEHSGSSSGSSRISSTTINKIKLKHVITRAQIEPNGDISQLGSIIAVPAIVQGKIYIGTGGNILGATGGGSLYKIDIDTGIIEKTHHFKTQIPSSQGYTGIARTPAVVSGKIYFSGLDGFLYCVDANSLNELWKTNLRNTDLNQNQPVKNSLLSEGWSAPLVINDKVYVGFGEGENGNYGFIYCINSQNGKVIWIFCTNKFSDSHNRPNVIPEDAVRGINLPADFSTHPKLDKDSLGIPVWSSLAYDKRLNRVYAGTGNTRTGDGKDPPDNEYGSGVISLDADTGEFKGYFQPDPKYNYRSNDRDVDMSAGPLLFTRDDDKRVLAIGNKAGAFFLLDPDTMKLIDNEKSIRQLLPYNSQKKSFDSLASNNKGDGGENTMGIFSCASVHHRSQKLFVGLGGYNNYDSTISPFLRCLNWHNLEDAWPISGNNPAKYITAAPPLYQTQEEKGIGSPTIVNDLVFMATSTPALYAFDVNTGVCHWTSPELINEIDTINRTPKWTTGAAVYGDYLAIGIGNDDYQTGKLFVYSL